MASSLTEEIGARRENILGRIRKAAGSCGREAGEIELVAVSKVQPDERIEAMLAAGHRVFGENRVQEAQAHWRARRTEFKDLRLHLIGPLQTNKAADAVALFDVIETLDREKLADALASAQEKGDRRVEVLIQVNTGKEAQKAGVAPDMADDLITYARDRVGLNVTGLMCIPPVGEAVGPHFALLGKIARRNGLTMLSMGMSSDFETAILFGATHVRIGSALFGERT